MRGCAASLLLAVVLSGCGARSEPDAPDAPGDEEIAAPGADDVRAVALRQVTSGLSEPVALAGDDNDRLFIADRVGVVYEVNGAIRVPVVDLRERLGRDGALRAVAVEPRFGADGRVVVHYTASGSDRVSAFRVNGPGGVAEEVPHHAAVEREPAAPPGPLLDGLDVVGGQVYTGILAPDLAGRYVFVTRPGDLYVATRSPQAGERWRVRRLDVVGPATALGPVLALEADTRGELYVLTGGAERVDGAANGGGRVYRVVSALTWTRHEG